MDSAGDDAAQDAGDKELGHALHADQQDDEHQGVGCALDGHEVLDVIAAVAFTVGDNARIAAGAVVLSAVPEDCTAVGVPAHVVRVAGKIATFADEVDQISVRDPVEEKLNAALSRLEFLEKLMDEQYLKSRREESAGSET